ncbi:MAG: protein-tyrosine-phosphatase [Hyphomonadaceae bacterium]|nr:protein-tyrosine-phosphatase [Hyphomonadaceae bacterium]
MSEAAPPGSVLFACTQNAIRSPMAAELMRLRFGRLVRVDSVGVRPAEEVSAMAAFVMDERGGEISRHRPKGFDAFEENEAGPFDLIVSLSPEAHHRALDLIPALGAAAEYWPTYDPSLTEGSREQVLLEYRAVRDALEKRIAARFARPSTG